MSRPDTKVFFVSNGHGEDMIACQIIKELRVKVPSISFSALPIVGEGRAYVSNQVPVIGSPRVLPSGGFSRLGLKYFFMDIGAGLIDLSFEQMRILRNEGRNSDFVIAVGDTFLCALCGFFTGKKIIFVSTAQSVFIGKFTLIDRINKWLMQYYAQVVFPRDEKTAESLRKFRIPAVYLGNVMMDCLEISGEDFGIPGTRKVIGLLPGSRNEAYGNFQSILEVVEQIGAESREKGSCEPAFIAALAPSLKIEIIKKIGQNSGWRFSAGESSESGRGVPGFLKKPSATVMISDRFADVIFRADVIIGLSGTGNEQAVGLGKPVVAFPGRGPQMTMRFLKDQSNLLGGMVFIVPDDRKVVARKIFSILDDPSVFESARKIGLERMGQKGAASRISSYMKENIFEK